MARLVLLAAITRNPHAAFPLAHAHNQKTNKHNINNEDEKHRRIKRRRVIIPDCHRLIEQFRHHNAKGLCRGLDQIDQIVIQRRKRDPQCKGQNHISIGLTAGKTKGLGRLAGALAKPNGSAFAVSLFVKPNILDFFSLQHGRAECSIIVTNPYCQTVQALVYRNLTCQTQCRGQPECPFNYIHFIIRWLTNAGIIRILSNS